MIDLIPRSLGKRVQKGGLVSRDGSHDEYCCWICFNGYLGVGLLGHPHCGALIKRIRPVQPDAVERRPIDRERETKFDAKLAAGRAEWELHGRAAAEAEAEEKLRRSTALISVPAIILAVVPDVPPPQISFVYLIGPAGSDGPFKIGKANNVERRLAQLQTSSAVKLLLIEYRLNTAPSHLPKSCP